VEKKIIWGIGQNLFFYIHKPFAVSTVGTVDTVGTIGAVVAIGARRTVCTVVTLFATFCICAFGTVLT
jgi:hypothetical protein